MEEARLYEQLPEGQVRCQLCAHRCTIADGKRGICHVRQNQAGKLYTLVYGRVIAQHVDPIEKKPLYHFYPGSRSYSIATPGCNMRCRWCQNADISQMPREQQLVMGRDVPPAQIVAEAQRTGCASIAYTYTEPTIFFEYSYDTARLAQEAGLANVYVTNGYMTGEMLAVIHPYLDAANVDLKAFRDESYRKYTGARLSPVLDSLKTMKKLGIWVEVTTLIVPTVNDDPAELRDIAQFVAGELGVETPWHISRFFPTYKMTDAPPTPISMLEEAYTIGRQAGLRHVYKGNAPGEENTLCHQCGRLLVRRGAFYTVENAVRQGRCPQCGTPVDGIWGER
jgi:pyruvate formate lyase activating enzyme